MRYLVLRLAVRSREKLCKRIRGGRLRGEKRMKRVLVGGLEDRDVGRWLRLHAVEMLTRSSHVAGFVDLRIVLVFVAKIRDDWRTRWMHVVDRREETALRIFLGLGGGSLPVDGGIARELGSVAKRAVEAERWTSEAFVALLSRMSTADDGRWHRSRWSRFFALKSLPRENYLSMFFRAICFLRILLQTWGTKMFLIKYEKHQKESPTITFWNWKEIVSNLWNSL